MRRFLFPLLGIFLLFTGCAAQPPATDTVVQVSTIDALLAGVYDGEFSADSLMQYGGFGLGTFTALDGEMVVFEGELYQVKADGKVYRPAPSIKTPFATVCQFAPEQSLALPAQSDMAAVEALIDEQAPNQNLFYAIQITGRFRYMKTRSVPAQQKPYPPLDEVSENQPEFEMENVSGVIVGFRCPPYTEGINVPGYHFHFLSDDRTQGGHILGFEIDEARCEIDVLHQYVLKLPTQTREFAETDLTQDRSEALYRVEKDQE